MPLTDRALSQTVIVADHERRLRRMRVAVGFDPNENPVIIGDSATGGGGSTPTTLTGASARTVAVGASSSVGGTDAVAVGDTASTSAQYTVAVGAGATADAVGAVAVGYLAGAGDDSVVVGREANAYYGTNHVCVGYSATVDGTSADIGGHSVEGTALGYGSYIASSHSVAVGSSAGAGHPFHTSQMATAVGYNTRAPYTHSTALGADATTVQVNQIMLGTEEDFVEIPGDSSTAPNGLVLTDTATGTRYIVQITSGALVLSAAP